MSKAAEWAKVAGAIPKFECSSCVSARVNAQGNLEIENGGTMSTRDALAFAKWIEETFGETETK